MSHRDHHHDHEQVAPLRERLQQGAREYWRSLEELADTDRFRDFLHREFPAVNAPDADPAWLNSAGRRNFLKLMSASMALAGLTACTRQPKEHVVPYVKIPDGLVPGKPQFFATAMTMNGVASGLLVESHEGRPTKVEGNPDHPASRGATDVFAQASVLQLYDPDRAQAITYLGDVRTWGDALNALSEAVNAQRGKRGAGLRILTETTTSPTLAAQFKQLLTDLPEAKWSQYEPAGRDGARMGAQMAFGQMVNTVYKFDAADVVLSLDADFLTSGPGALRYARDFISKRKLTDGAQTMSRFYSAESTLTPTGAKADHRLPLRASEIENLARVIAAKVGVAGATGNVTGDAEKFAEAVAKDLKAHSGKSIVIAGEHQSATVHALAHALNAALGNVGATVAYTDSLEGSPVDQNASIKELVGELNAGKVETLVIIGANPVYNAPADLNFLDALKKAKLRFRLGLYNDETAEQCEWQIPETHYLEAWSDARAFDGTVSIIQPLIQPLYAGCKSAHEVLGGMTNQPGKSALDIVRDYWKTQPQLGGAEFDKRWKQALHDGVIADTALPAKPVAVVGDLSAKLAQPKAGGQYEIVFRPDPCVYDGRFANNGWLQELPKPITKITWDNVALMSPHTAEALGVAVHDEWDRRNAKMVKLTNEGRELTMPAWAVPGHPDNAVTVHLGYGRDRAGNVGTKLGFNTYRLRTSANPWIATNAKIEAAEGEYLIASTQEHFNIDTSGLEEGDLAERHIVRTTSLSEYNKDPKVLHHGAHQVPQDMTMYHPEQFPNPTYAWGMTIDMNACVGCNACVTSCQSENNIAVVGKEMVVRGRVMHWLRIDTYFKGGAANPEVYFQPMLCQHCEQAPCEVVCPVNATVHDAEGLNLQVYNRCVGTRYCANNCPYKVRRFNYFLYGDWDTPSLRNVRNPEVTIRSRGVMEKCTYCVQRIMVAKIESEKQNRRIQDGEIVTACQSVCPTDAIIFGDLNDPNSRASKLKKEVRNYNVLEELNTRPRTSYLAAIRNVNGELGGSAAFTTDDKNHKPEIRL